MVVLLASMILIVSEHIRPVIFFGSMPSPDDCDEVCAECGEKSARAPPNSLACSPSWKGRMGQSTQVGYCLYHAIPVQRELTARTGEYSEAWRNCASISLLLSSKL